MTNAGILVRVFFNEADGHFEGFRHGDELKESKLSPLTVLTGDLSDPLAICESIWERLNADDRPNRMHERSLSVGDVLEVDGRLYAVENTGFRLVQEAKDFDWSENA